jgi:hypothetical protein
MSCEFCNYPKGGIGRPWVSDNIKSAFRISLPGRKLSVEHAPGSIPIAVFTIHYCPVCGENLHGAENEEHDK